MNGEREIRNNLSIEAYAFAGVMGIGGLALFLKGQSIITIATGLVMMVFSVHALKDPVMNQINKP